MALIVCKDAALGYDTGIVVRDLDFQVEAGDYLLVVGENGSGKSTLLKSLLRLRMPVYGAITMGGGLKANEIGYLPQQSAAQKDFPASVYEVVLSGRQSRRGPRPFYSRLDKRIALENIQKLGIIDLKSKCFRELSGGQQQRALLARALCATEKLLLLDEPVAGLDPLAAQEFYGLLRMLNKEQGITIVMVTHDVKEAFADASHILHLENSQKFFGTAPDYQKTAYAHDYIGSENHA